MDVSSGDRPDWRFVRCPRPSREGERLFEAGELDRLRSYAGSLATLLDVNSSDDSMGGAAAQSFQCTVPGCNREFTCTGAFEAHYRAAHYNACDVCGKVLPTEHLLTLHVLECHDTLFTLMAAKRPMFECLLSSCGHRAASRKARKAHMVEAHHYPRSFRINHFLGIPRNHRTIAPVRHDRAKAAARPQIPQAPTFGRRGRGRGRGRSLGHRGRGRGPRLCYRCNQPGHLMRDCPNTPQPEAAADDGDVDMGSNN